jgi:hypothetical protein
MPPRPVAHTFTPQATIWLVLIAIVLCGTLPLDALAQRPFRLYDPFYRGETARRSFFDGYAVTAEVRTAGSQPDLRQTNESDPFGVSLRLDYELLTNIDLSAIFDAAASNSGRTVTLSWVVLKYYRTVENSDYAVRLAVDPSFDGRTGSPQMDLAFISTTLLSPVLSSDYALGVRRVRMGVEQFVPGNASSDPPTVPEPRSRNDIVYTRALGWEVHFMAQYALLLNPARSNIFLSVLVDRGEYSVFETSLRESRNDEGTVTSAPNRTRGVSGEAGEFTKQYRGGVLWFRPGVEFNRPGYQVIPFVSMPLKQWIPEDDDWSRARMSIGVRLMLR